MKILKKVVKWIVIVFVVLVVLSIIITSVSNNKTSENNESVSETEVEETHDNNSEDEIVKPAEETTEESNSEMDEIREYLADFGLAVYDEPDYYTDEKCKEYYDEIQSVFNENDITIEDMRDILWNSEIAIYTEDEVNTMSDWDVYTEWTRLAYETAGMYTDDEIEDNIITAANFSDWSRSVTEGESVAINDLTIFSITPSINRMYCELVDASGTVRYYVYVSTTDTGSYIKGDVINVTGIYTGRDMGNNAPIIEATSITLN